MKYDLTKEERNWAIGLHLSAFSGFVVPFGSLLGPLVVWLIKRDDHEFLDRSGRTAVNVHGTVTAVSLIFLLLLGLFFLGTLLLAYLGFPVFYGGYSDKMTMTGIISIFVTLSSALDLLSYVYAVVAAIKANKREIYVPPYVFKFLKEQKPAA